MTDRVEERPEYGWLKELKASRGEALRRRYGAHSLGIGRKRRGGKPTDQLALVFYVARKRAAEPGDQDGIPPTIEFTPAGASTAVRLATDVRETDAAEDELGLA